MGRRSRPRTSAGAGDFEFERTMADAEAEAAAPVAAAADDAACLCGHREFVLEAFLHVVAGRIDPDPVEVEALTCPECGREYDAVPMGGGRVVRGDFRGFADLDEE